MTDGYERRVATYHGSVQGVGFRATALHLSRGLDVHGFVRNEVDGSVKLDVEGPPEAVQELLNRIATQMQAKIDQVDIQRLAGGGRNDGFRIAH